MLAFLAALDPNELKKEFAYSNLGAGILGTIKPEFVGIPIVDTLARHRNIDGIARVQLKPHLYRRAIRNPPTVVCKVIKAEYFASHLRREIGGDFFRLGGARGQERERQNGSAKYPCWSNGGAGT